MKKIFTLIAVACMALTASAKYQLSLEELTNGWGSIYDPETKTITYEESAWGGRGWNMSAEDPFNYVQEGYDYVVVKVKSSDVLMKLVAEYTDGTTDDNGYVKVGSDDKSFDPGTKLLALPFSEDQEKLIQIYIQNSTWSNEIEDNPAGTVVLEDAFLCTEEEYQAIVDAAEAAKVAIWEGSNDFGYEWNYELAVIIDAEKFANAAEGSVLEFTHELGTYANDYGVYSQYKISAKTDPEETVLTGNKADQNEYGCVSPSNEKYSFTLNAEDVALLKENGMVVTGYNITMKKVTLDNSDVVSDGISAAKNEKVVNNNVMYNLAGQQVSKNYKGIVIQNGKKFINK